MTSSHLSIFARAFIIVALTAGNVRLVSDGRYAWAFFTGGCLSAVWWGNAGLAAHHREDRSLGLAYALGAACGTVTGMWIAAR